MHGEEANNTTLDDMTLLTEGNWYTCLPYKTRFDHGDLFPKLRDNSGRIVSLDDNNTVVLRLDRGASILFVELYLLSHICCSLTILPTCTHFSVHAYTQS